MKLKEKIFIGILFGYITLYLIFCFISYCFDVEQNEESATIKNHSCGKDSLCNYNEPKPTEWELFIQALIYVESRGNSKAVGKGDCVGILQITPIYVKECNRLLKTEKYTNENRFDSLKSLEMFGIIQNYYNPNKDIDRAIYYHNKTAPISYSDKIKNRIKYLKTI
jgi:hypothetical protein